MHDVLQKILSPEGSLSQLIPGYEERKPQQEMLIDVLEAFESRKIAVIEAGTGVGKSIAYLLPSLLWAIKHKERVVISTNTITLQEQLLFKDLPLAQRALGSDIKAVLVKGMSNYLCLRKLEEAKVEKRTLPDKEYEQLSHIEDWAELTADGTLSDLSITPSYHVWEKVCAEGDTCSFRKCPYYKNCHFFRARKEAETAQVLISNHSLLFADLAIREGGGLMPEYRRVVLDEAHRIEDAATNFFADRVSYISLMRLMGRLGTDRQGKLAALKDRIMLHYLKQTPPEITPILSRLNIDLPSLRKDLQIHLANFFTVLISFAQRQKSDEEAKIRLIPSHYLQSDWKNGIVPLTTTVLDSSKKYIQSANQLLNELLHIDDAQLQEKTEGLRLEIQALLNRLIQASEIIGTIILKECPSTKVRWIETNRLKTSTNIHLIQAPLEIGELMAQKLFSSLETTILTSATISTNKNFHFFQERIGLKESLLDGKGMIERQYQSPFDYETQAKLIIPQDMPDPQDPSFFDQAVAAIWNAITASQGNAFVLFTSYGMMEKCAGALEKRLQESRYPLFKQGTTSRKEILDQFKKTKSSVLFGTDSFWEGVDVAGDALRCVILVKLPFRVPSEPLLQARTEFIKEKGNNPFYSYHLPSAIVKFKQGFGRLIRHKKDRGCIVCLDSRLITRSYGKQFLSSLPPCNYSIIRLEEINKEMKSFYKE